MKKRYSKREIFNIIIYLLVIFFIGIGVTFSYFSLVAEAEKDSTKIYAGKMDINFIQGQDISTDILFPIPEPSFNQERNVYRNRFTVRTTGTLEQMVSINFVSTLNEFESDSIMYAVYTGTGSKLATGYINQENNVLVDNLYFKDNESRDFVLILWLNDNKKNQNQEMKKKLTGTIVINSTQMKY